MREVTLSVLLCEAEAEGLEAEWSSKRNKCTTCPLVEPNIAAMMRRCVMWLPLPCFLQPCAALLDNGITCDSTRTSRSMSCTLKLTAYVRNNPGKTSWLHTPT